MVNWVGDDFDGLEEYLIKEESWVSYEIDYVILIYDMMNNKEMIEVVGMYLILVVLIMEFGGGRIDIGGVMIGIFIKGCEFMLLLMKFVFFDV